MLLAIMLFIIGQALNLSVGYWIVWGIWLIVEFIKDVLSLLIGTGTVGKSDT